MKKVLLLGAGYANIAFLKSLPQDVFSQAEFTIISQTQMHYTSILLHEVVSGSRNQSTLFNLKEILPPQVHFIQDTICEIQKQKVRGEKGEYEYEYLLVGLGFQSDHFGIKGIKEYASAIVNYEGALQLHQKIKEQIKKAQQGDTKALKFAICGGGFSGIELISSLAEELPKMCLTMGVNPKNIELTCIEAMPNILPMFQESLIQAGVDYLKNTLGIHLAVGSKILECQEDGVIVEQNGQQNKIEAGLIIWTAGVKGNGVIENSAFFTSARSKVEINEYLQPINQEQQEEMKNIYILGDCAALKDPSSGRFFPPTAQIATRQGKYLAQNFHAILNQLPISQAFSYTPQGTICSLGENYAIGNIGSKELKGKTTLYLKHFIEAKWRWDLNGLKGVFNGK